VKERLKDLVRASSDATEVRNRVREYLQAEILGSLQRSGAMVPLAFQGGTALRFLYSIRRFSEDLDFALERPEHGYDFRKILKAAQSDLAQEGYAVEARRQERPSPSQRLAHRAGRLGPSRVARGRGRPRV